jgi:CxxC-x17-CxxC domain-containing protein
MAMELSGEHKEKIILFGETNFRDKRVRFGIKPDDRRRHMYVIGKTGSGKTTLIENMVVQDIQNGHGVAVIDPHGEFADRMLDFVPKDRVDDVVYFNPADLDYPIAFNAIEQVPVEYRHLVAAGLMAVFKKIWVDLWSARMEYILNNTLLSLLEIPDSTLLGVNRMLADKTYRQGIVDRLTDPVVKAFWVNEFERYDARFRAEAVAPIQNKVGQFASNPLIRNIVGQTKSKLNLREVLDSRKILIANLSKGLIGEENSALLGAMLVTKLQLAAMSRVDVPEPERADFYLYVDEFQNYATDSFANILSEARKYRLNLILVHQYIAQLVSKDSSKVKDAIFGNVGTIVSFRVGAEDAELLEREFEPEFTANDLVNLPKYNFYIKLMIDGTASRAFSATNLPPPAPPALSHREDIIRISRERYATPRREVEDAIREWSGDYVLPVAGTAAEGARRPPMQAVTTAQRMWDVVCTICQKPTKVPFEPDGKRPVYCSECLKQLREAERSAAAVPAPARGPKPIPLAEAFKKAPPSSRPGPQSPAKKKPDVDIEGLRSVLKEALEKKEQ